MYNSDDNTQFLVDEKIKKHQLWLETSGAQGERAVFKGSLSGLDFSGKDLSRADFEWSSGENINFSKSVLNGAMFGAVHYKSPIMREADLRESDFSHSEIIYGDFTLSFCARANFSESRIVDCNVDGAIMTRVNFILATIETDLSKANTQGSVYEQD